MQLTRKLLEMNESLYPQYLQHFPTVFVQWGKYQSGGGSDRNITITFPIAFAQYCYAITFGSIQYSAFPDKLTLVQSISKSNVLVHFDDYCAGAYYIIIGK